MRPTVSALAAAVIALVIAPASHAGMRPEIGALQIALRANRVYKGPLDGLRGRETVDALRRLQSRAGLPATGVLDGRTRAALGRLGSPPVGHRVIGLGMAGWDVAWLEFLLAMRGFDPGRIDGRFDGATRAATRRFRRYARLEVGGTAGLRAFAALRQAKRPRSPLALGWPLDGTVRRRFGIHRDRLHPGISLAASFGAGLAAAADGEVVFAGRRRGRLGLSVIVRHRRGVSTVYGHLARIDVRPGDRVIRGAFMGLVGRTGRTPVPALYFEVRVRGAAVDPLTVLRPQRRS